MCTYLFSTYHSITSNLLIHKCYCYIHFDTYLDTFQRLLQGQRQLIHIYGNKYINTWVLEGANREEELSSLAHSIKGEYAQSFISVC